MHPLSFEVPVYIPTCTHMCTHRLQRWLLPAPTHASLSTLHTTIALLSLVFFCMAAPPTKHFTLPPLKLHITFHKKGDFWVTHLWWKNRTRKHQRVWLGRDVIRASYRMKCESDIHLAGIVLVGAQRLVFWCRGGKKRNKTYFSERGLNSIK